MKVYLRQTGHAGPYIGAPLDSKGCRVGPELAGKMREYSSAASAVTAAKTLLGSNDRFDGSDLLVFDAETHELLGVARRRGGSQPTGRTI